MNETMEMVLRLVLAAVLGGLIGAEREWRAKVAGMRTHILVALGSALMMLVSQHGFGGEGDPGRVAAQIVSGGRIGLQVELSPEALGQLVPYALADIVAEEA